MQSSILPSPYNQPSCIEYTSDFGCSNLQRNFVREDDMRDLLKDAFRLGTRNLGDFNEG